MAVTGTWRVAKPIGTEPIRDLTIWMPDNWEYIQTWLQVEHVFPGSHGENAGMHRPGHCRVMKYSASAAIGSMIDVPSGAIAYITDKHRFVYYDSGEWTSPACMLHTRNGSMTGNLDVTGTYLDGRSPSADGARLDTFTIGADAFGVHSEMNKKTGETVAVPSMPTSIDYIAQDDCKFLAVQTSGSIGCSCTISQFGGLNLSSTRRAMCFVIGVK